MHGRHPCDFGPMPQDPPAPESQTIPVDCRARQIDATLAELGTLVKETSERSQRIFDKQLELHQAQVALDARVRKFVDPVGLVPRMSATVSR